MDEGSGRGIRAPASLPGTLGAPNPNRLARGAAIIAVASLAVAGAAGCGGDSSEQLDAAQLISKGDELCRQGQQHFAEIQAKRPANATDAQEQTDELLDVATDELTDLRDLRPPEELRDSYESYLEARGRALELLEQGSDAAGNRDAEEYAKAQAEVTADQPARVKLAEAVGLKVCSRAGTTAPTAAPAP